MAVLRVISYPNPLLKQVSRQIENFDSSLHTLLDDMYETMRAKEGVGIAAVQVGVLLRALLVLPPREDGEQDPQDLLEILNPKVVHKEGEIFWSEGCLSVPGFFEDIRRFETLYLDYQDRKGERKSLEAKGFLAVALQHEMDHLNGILFIDYLSLPKRKKFEQEYKRLQKQKRNL